MTNKYKNKIKSMKFLNQSRTRTTPTAREMRESYREKEADESILRTTRGSIRPEYY